MMKTRRKMIALTGGFGLTGILGCNPTSGVPTQQSDKGTSLSSTKATFRMRPEDAPHERTFMQWPASASIYGGRRYLEEAQESIARIANSISAFEPVVMLGADNQANHIKKLVSGDVEHWNVPTEDLWCRDSGPTFVVSDDGALAIMDFNFNGWGNKQKHVYDGAIARSIAERMGLAHLDSGVVGEAGGLETDGAGVVIAHESSWVNKNRNTVSREEIEHRILGATGAQKMIWAPGLKGADITDYHIDALARFIAPGKLLIQLPEKVDRRDPFSAAAYETYEILKNATDAAGEPFEITVIKDPVDIRGRSDDFVASYVNYYLCNNAIIAAEFGDRAADEHARETLAELYPARDIIMLNIDAIGDAGGGVHCATHEQPKA